MKKNESFIGTCTDYTYNGLGVVKNGTFCVFVKDMVMGETGKIVITAVRKDYAYGRLLELTEPGKERVTPPCSISKQCGGCQLQHMSYQEQLRFKQHHVRQTLTNIGKIDVAVNDIIPLENPLGYRNKVILPVGNQDGKTVMGFYRYNSHDIIAMDDCVMQSTYSNHLAEKLRSLIDKHELTEQIRNVMIRDFDSTAEAMVVLVTWKKEVQGLSELIRELTQGEERIKAVIQNINDRDTNVVLGKEEILLYGQWHINDILDGLKFEVSSRSFYQVNSRQTIKLYGEAIRMADLKDSDTAIDLYCGVGTIGMLASKKAGKVIGVEIVPEAIENARRNAEINGIKNIEFMCGDALTAVRRFKDNGERPEVVFVDPPRKGCSEEVLANIVAMAPEKVVYVSCNPSTLARDLHYMSEQGYVVKEVQPVDMFSQTFHVETVCLLQRIKEGAPA